MTTKVLIKKLPTSAHYFPISGDRYSTRAGLARFGTDFGNGQLDTQLFQFDKTFTDYRNNKLAVRKTEINDYVCTDKIDNKSLAEATQFILQHLCNEHPDKFLLQKSSKQITLDCLLTDEQIIINDDYNLATQHRTEYKNLFDALALQVQEDICLMQINSSGTKLIAAHLCAANHWSARDKLLMDMRYLHQHVPGFTDDNKEPEKLLQGISRKTEAYVRFAWGLCDQAILNQHPHTSLKSESSDDLFMRIERQVIWPIPDSDILLFTIRTYFQDYTELKTSEIISLGSAVSSMSKETLEYKNIDKEAVIKKLKIMRQN
ncbi:MAG: DUF3445 domain-containing protein [Sulfuriflexus sp.]|nr:DUF3445 domain-containing protein [Sulfuriflexus sp.]